MQRTPKRAIARAGFAVALAAVAVSSVARPAVARLAPREGKRPASVHVCVTPARAWQRQAPARVVTTIATARHVEYAALINRANVDAVSVQIAVLARDLATDEVLGVFGAESFDLRIPAGGFASIAEPLWRTPNLARYARRSGSGAIGAELHVTRVVLADGRVWSERPKASGFSEEAANGLDELLWERLEPLVERDASEYSIATSVSRAGVAQPETNSPQPTCVQYPDSRQKCKYTTVNGAPGCQSSTCSRLSVNCSNEKCVMAIIVEPEQPPAT